MSDCFCGESAGVSLYLPVGWRCEAHSPAAVARWAAENQVHIGRVPCACYCGETDVRLFPRGWRCSVHAPVAVVSRYRVRLVSDVHDRAVELVLSGLGGRVIPDGDGQVVKPDGGVEVVAVLSRAGRCGKRASKRDPSPGQAGLF